MAQAHTPPVKPKAAPMGLSPPASPTGPLDAAMAQAAKLLASRSLNPPMPKRVIVDRSCSGNPAAFDPVVQAAALDALARSTADNPSGKAEFGFFASPNIGSDSHSVGPIFSSGFQKRMPVEDVARRQPGLVRSLLNGSHRPDMFVHAHPNYRPPSPVGPHDQRAAKLLGLTVAAIDKIGTLTCTRK